MVNSKESHKTWWSNNLVGIIVAALLAVLLGYQGVHQSQAYQDKQIQTQINLNVARALEALNADEDGDTEFHIRLDAAIEKNEESIQSLDRRVTVIETKID